MADLAWAFLRLGGAPTWLPYTIGLTLAALLSPILRRPR
jgi:hypothetical protein